MARANLKVATGDGGIGFLGPGSRAIRAVIGVGSIVPSNGQPVVVTSPADIETLVGVGPIRDSLAHDLSVSGGTVVATPIARSTGGDPIGAGTALESGDLKVTPLSTGYALGMQLVVLVVTTGGAPGTAAFRLIVDGLPQDDFTPSAVEIAAATYTIPADSLGTLADGVAAADYLKVNFEFQDGKVTGGDHSALATLQGITAGALTIGGTAVTTIDFSGAGITDLAGVAAALQVDIRAVAGLGASYSVAYDLTAGAFVITHAGADVGAITGTSSSALGFDDPAETLTHEVTAGERVEWWMSEPSPSNSDLTDAIEPTADHELPWRDLTITGIADGAAITAVNTAVRALAVTGRFVWVGMQVAGPDARTGGSSTSTAAWVSGLLGGIASAPPRQDSPVLMVCDAWARVTDPIYTSRKRIRPALYPIMAAIHKRRSWQPPDAVKYGRLEFVDSIYPDDMTQAQSNSLDDIWHTTLSTYEGRRGVYITHARMWGQYPTVGITASDYTGVERVRVINQGATAVREVLFPYTNDTVAVDVTGYMAESAKQQWRAAGAGEIDDLVQLGAIVGGDVIVDDPAPGILRGAPVKVTVRITPLAKAESIEATLFYYVAPASAIEEVA